VLQAHQEGRLTLPDLQERFAGASKHTLRNRVVSLREFGAIARRPLKRMPYAVENELTDLGHEMLSVAERVEAWLVRSPHGALALGGEEARGAIGALIGGWESTILWVLAREPLPMTALSGMLPEISYPSIERRLSAMRTVRQVEAWEGRRGAKPHAVTKWTRQAVGPLLAAGRCEYRRKVDETLTLSAADIEAGLLLALPLASPPDERSDHCQVQLENGRVACRIAAVNGEPTWALGSAEAWAGALLDDQLGELQFGGGEPAVAEAFIAALHSALPSPRTTQER
jgi:DNA-binding HxlR family transcriptional regulator